MVKRVLHEPTDMSDKEWSPSNILDVFGDSVARATLVIADGGPVSVKEIAEHLDVSNPTIYRRIEPLVDANLLEERRRIDTDGNQHKEYVTILEEATFRIDDDSYTVDIQVDQDLTDDFESMWSDLESDAPRQEPAETSTATGANTSRSDPA